MFQNSEHYVHYKGGIYRTCGHADDGVNPDDPTKTVVVYENSHGRRFYRTVADFTQIVDPRTGEPAKVGIRRFQQVVGWFGGTPIVGNENGTVSLFVSQWVAP